MRLILSGFAKLLLTNEIHDAIIGAVYRSIYIEYNRLVNDKEEGEGILRILCVVF